MRFLGLLALMAAGCTVDNTEALDGKDNDGDGLVDEWVGGSVIKVWDAGQLALPTPPLPARAHEQHPSVVRSDLSYTLPDSDDRLVASWEYHGPSERDGLMIFHDDGGEARVTTETVGDGVEMISQKAISGGVTTAEIVTEFDDKGRITGRYNLVPTRTPIREVSYGQEGGQDVAYVIDYRTGLPFRWSTLYLDAQGRVEALTETEDENEEPMIRREFTFEDDRVVLEEWVVIPDPDQKPVTVTYDWSFDDEGRPLEVVVTPNLQGEDQNSDIFTYGYDDMGRLDYFQLENDNNRNRQELSGTYGDDGYLVGWSTRETRKQKGEWKQRREQVWSGSWSDELGGIVGQIEDTLANGSITKLDTVHVFFGGGDLEDEEEAE